MFIVAPMPPAMEALVNPCSDYKPVNLHISYTTTALSPDCRWAVVSIGSNDIESGKAFTSFRLPKLVEISSYRAFVIERATGRIVYNFEMERSASLHWLKDNHHLIINYFEGSGSDIPLFFVLKAAPIRKPIDLSALIWSSVLKRANIPDKRPYGLNNWTYHYYTNFVEDTGDSLMVSAELWYTQNGTDGSGKVKCYIYSVSKTTLRYRFVREGNINTCPRNLDESEISGANRQ